MRTVAEQRQHVATIHAELQRIYAAFKQARGDIRAEREADKAYKRTLDGHRNAAPKNDTYVHAYIDAASIGVVDDDSPLIHF